MLFQLIRQQTTNYCKEYAKIPSLAWWLIIGTGVSNLLNFACLPFLAIILSRQGSSSLYIGIVLGVCEFTFEVQQLF